MTPTLANQLSLHQRICQKRLGVTILMTSPEHKEQHKRYQIGLMVLLGCVFFFESLMLGLASLLQIERSSFLTYVFPLTIGIILTLWFYYDSREKDQSLGLDQGFIIFVTWPITIPAYVIRTRGLRSGCLFTVAFICTILLPFFCGFVFASFLGSGPQ